MNYLYRCTFCNKRYTRKWNAKRHNADKHNNLADIYSIKENIVLSIKEKMVASSESQLDLMDEEQLALDIIGELTGPVDELAQLMQNNLQLANHNDLVNIFMDSLSSPNPVQTLDSWVKWYRCLAGRNRLVGYIVTSKGMLPSVAQLFLTQMIKDSPYFKKRKPLYKDNT